MIDEPSLSGESSELSRSQLEAEAAMCREALARAQDLIAYYVAEGKKWTEAAQLLDENRALRTEVGRLTVLLESLNHHRTDTP